MHCRCPQALERDNHIDSQFDVGLDTTKEDDDEEIAQDVQNKKRKKKSSLKSLPQAKSFDQFVAEVCFLFLLKIHMLIAYAHTVTIFIALLFQLLPAETAAYVQATMGPSRVPARSFCSVCGVLSKYTCMRCGNKVCGPKCDGMHRETRCVKF
jgi:hypothetical protein